MLLNYKKVKNTTGSTRTKVPYDGLQFCCEEAREGLAHTIDYRETEDGMAIVLLTQNTRRPDAEDEPVISHCPFCGNKIRTNFMGTFERRTEEVRIDDE